jgi:hypothetical protein
VFVVIIFHWLGHGLNHHLVDIATLRLAGLIIQQPCWSSKNTPSKKTPSVEQLTTQLGKGCSIGFGAQAYSSPIQQPCWPSKNTLSKYTPSKNTELNS